MALLSNFTFSAICGKNTLKMLQKSIFNHEKNEKIRQPDVKPLFMTDTLKIFSWLKKVKPLAKAVSIRNEKQIYLSWGSCYY
jgi:hypothetical protein